MHLIFALLASLNLSLDPGVKNEIIKILKPHKDAVGFSLRDQSGQELIGVNSQKFFTPASVAKTVSSACSLWQLGSDYKFQTEFGYTGKIVNGVLKGDLVVKGSGDPSFVIEDLKEVLEKIQVLHGIREITGKVVFDLSYFGKKELQIVNDFNGDEGRAFRTPLTAFSLNHNAFSVWIVPDETKPSAKILPKGVYPFQVINKLKTAKYKYFVNLDYRFDTYKIILSGTVPVKSKIKAYYRALPKPFESHAQLFLRVWRELGGVWKAPRFLASTGGVDSKKLWTHTSKPISRMLLDINKLSTNFASELLFLRAAAERFGLPVSPIDGSKMMSACLKHFGVSEAQIVLKNASGLSRESKVKPAALSTLLSKFSHLEFSPEYFASLSILGRDGTMKERLPDLSGRARLKTGSLRGVRALAGYVFPKGGDALSLVLLFRCSKCGGLGKVEDRILNALLENRK